MTLAHELGKNITDILAIPPWEFALWASYFKILEEERAKKRRELSTTNFAGGGVPPRAGKPKPRSRRK